MVDIKNTQQRIRNLVSLYKQEFPEEYHFVVDAVARKRGGNKNEFGTRRDTIKQDIGALERALYEIPEKLSVAIISNLDAEESQYLYSKDGARWFAKTFKMFSLAEKI